MKTKMLFLSIFAFFNGVWAQPSAVLEDYVRQGLESNLLLKQKQLDLQRALNGIEQARSLYFPKITFDANYTVAAGGRRIQFPIGDLLNGVYQNLNYLNSQEPNNPFPPFPVLENQEIQFLPNNFHETKVSFSLPVYNSDLSYNRRIQTQLYKSAEAQKQAYASELRYQITAAYLQYLQIGEAEKIWRNAKSVLVELRRFNESLVKNNVATKDVVASADYEISKADKELAMLQGARKTTQAYINTLINRELNSEIISDTTLLRSVLPSYDPDGLLQNAENNRRELEALRAGLEAAALNAKRADADRRLPDFYLGGSLGFQGFGYSFDREQAYAVAQIGMSYPIFDGGLQKEKTQEARIEAEKVKNQYDVARQQIRLQVAKSWNDLESAVQAYESAQQGLQAAESSFRIASNKYKAGQMLLIEYLDAQNKRTSAQLQTVLAWSDVLLREAALRQAAGQ